MMIEISKLEDRNLFCTQLIDIIAPNAFPATPRTEPDSSVRTKETTLKQLQIDMVFESKTKEREATMNNLMNLVNKFSNSAKEKRA